MHQLFFSIILTLGCAFLASGYSLATPVNDVRAAYQTAHKSESYFNEFYELIGEYDGADPVLLAYNASATALKGKFAMSPVTKVKHAKIALAQLDSLCLQHAEHTEILFLRLAIERNIPSFLNMSGHIEKDTEKIINTLPLFLSRNKQTGEFIISSLVDFELLSDEEATSIKAHTGNE